MTAYALAREVLGQPTTGLLAAGLAVLSPVFAVQSGTYLPYLFTRPTGGLALRRAHTGAPWAHRPTLAHLLDSLRAYSGPPDSTGWVLWLLLVALVGLGVFGAVGRRGVIELRPPPPSLHRSVSVCVVSVLVLALVSGMVTETPD